MTPWELDGAQGEIEAINETIAFIEGTRTDLQQGTIVARPVFGKGEPAFASAPSAIPRETRQTLLLDRESELRNPATTNHGRVREIDRRLKAMDERIAELVERRTYYEGLIAKHEEQVAERRLQEEEARRRLAAEYTACWTAVVHHLDAIVDPLLALHALDAARRRLGVGRFDLPDVPWVTKCAIALQQLPDYVEPLLVEAIRERRAALDREAVAREEVTR